jgi:hypothetical protein
MPENTHAYRVLNTYRNSVRIRNRIVEDAPRGRRREDAAMQLILLPPAMKTDAI